MIKLSERIQQWSRGWVVLGLIALFVLLSRLPLGDPALISASLDGRFGYTAGEALDAIASYGSDGRTQMVWIHLGDFLLIALYTAVFCTSISWLFRRGFKPKTKIQRLNLVPIAGGLFDVMENIWILILLWSYPARPMLVGRLAAIFTTGKYSMGVFIIALLVIGLVRAGMNHFKVQGG